ncbi:VirB4 family type IV secretion/conjugal transfer ATPase [Gilvimarinus chinensis]|uniref:VirB4 family type IV secretion/conjugal transfer ATPase n=1 Tax=Gilvimarinus chinensis TaxID=396005 RepID=UPI00037A113D|nr:VirB4 family type IV secretion/conjugal transfer ATPase [Gilvimarinus chinensis]
MGVQATKHGNKLAMEAGGEAHIPITSHVDPNTLRTKDGKLIQIIKVEGVPHETSDTAALNQWKNSRNFLWRSIADSRVSVWTHIVRHKKSEYPAGQFKDGFSKQLNKKYRESLKNTEMYVNDLYICVVRQGSTDKVAGFSEVLKSLLSKSNNESIRLAQAKQVGALNESSRKILKGLGPYNARLLSVYSRDLRGIRAQIVKTDDAASVTDSTLRITESKERKLLKEGALIPYSEPLEFIGFLVNGFWRHIPMGYTNAGKTVLASRIHFKKELFVVESTNRSRVGGTISIKEYHEKTAPGMIDGLLTLPVEFVLTQSFTFKSKSAAIHLLSQHQSRMKNAGDLAEAQINDLDDALSDLTANKFCMGDHHFTLTALSNNVKTLADDLALCEAELSECGVLTAREYLGLEAAFWAQIPANNSYIARKAPITSTNFSSLVSLHNYPQGSLKGNHWGPAVALLKTVSGTPYYFNFHYPKDLGNTTVIGPSGAGKTVLMLFLMAMLEKLNPRQIFFDKDRGAEIFIRAQGGTYSPIEAGVPTGFNPLQLPDTERNRKFLRDWLAKLAEDPSRPHTAEDLEQFATAVNGNYKLDKRDRRLSNIYDFFQYSGENDIKARLKGWLENGDRGWVFDNEEDSLELDARLMGFDVTDFLDDATIRTPLLMYLFHRINGIIDGSRLGITLDEGWKLLDDEYFGARYKDWLKVLRKQNGFTVFGTQEPADVLTSAVGSTILSQSPTKIFLPNPDAQRKDYVEGFGLTDREFDLIKSTPIESRRFIIKQGKKSVVAELDLANMDDEIAVLSGTTANVDLMNRIRAEVGDDPADWLPIFHERRN